jgi:ubiquinone/menaquinone biosynthesis C-methylase UbiE
MDAVKTKKREAEIFDEALRSRKSSFIHQNAPMMEELQYPWRRRLLDLVSVDRDSRVLDLGCGSGGWSESIGQSVHQVVGIDISLERIKVAKKNAENESLNNLHFFIGDAENLPFPSDYFNIVFCAAILHHLPDLNQAFREIHRVLKIDGKIILSEPGLLNPFAFVRRKFFPSEIHTPDETPFIPFRLKKFIELNYSNLISEYKYFVSCAFPFLSRFIGKRLSTKLMMFSYKLDIFLLQFSFIQQFCWIIIMKGEKTSKRFREIGGLNFD